MKRILTSALVVMATTLGFSQEVKFGLKGGVNLATVKVIDLEEDEIHIPDYRTSFYAGGLVEFPLGDKLYGQVEVLYVSNGAKQDKNQVIINQINVPFMVKYNVVDGLNVVGGGYLGGILGYKVKSGNRIIKADPRNISFLDGGLILGAEYNLPNNGLFFDARYNLGLANVVKPEEEDGIIKNRGFQIGLGYKF
ncbi:porin family protein [Riemerella anatipestifer]|nr:porin family protein [Riemerella anatipestifer]MDY3324852.1 porin family protein [Riemerella anatipestifer]MDY3353662.1 porin family protein [Riemerella anatipestifer]